MIYTYESVKTLILKVEITINNSVTPAQRYKIKNAYIYLRLDGPITFKEVKHELSSDWDHLLQSALNITMDSELLDGHIWETAFYSSCNGSILQNENHNLRILK